MVGWVICEHSAHRALDLEVRQADLECKGGARVKRCKVEVDACVTMCRQSAHRGLPRLRAVEDQVVEGLGDLGVLADVGVCTRVQGR